MPLPPQTPSPPATPDKKEEEPAEESPFKKTMRISPLMLAMMPPGSAPPAPSPTSTSSLATTDPARHITEPEMLAIDPALIADVAPAFNLAPGQPLPRLVPDEAPQPGAETPAAEPAPNRPPWGWLLVAGLACLLLTGAAVAVFRFLPSAPRPSAPTAIPTRRPASIRHSAPATSDQAGLIEPLSPTKRPSPPHVAAKKRPPTSPEAPAPAPPPTAPATAAAPPPANDFGFLPADAAPPKAPLKGP